MRRAPPATLSPMSDKAKPLFLLVFF